MADQSYGLRFDIYERLHLPENVVGIEELEEIELIPKIQVVPGEEYASLRGHLLLSGLYRGEGSTQTLEHWIPVEITIPLARIGRLEDISVEIENFDVDLLSARSLNVTGILSLQGVASTNLTSQAEEWKDRELVVAHEPEQSYSGGQDWRNNEQYHSLEQNSVPELPDLDEQETVLSWNNTSSPLFAQSIEEDKADMTDEAELASRDPQADVQFMGVAEQPEASVRSEARPDEKIEETATDIVAEEIAANSNQESDGSAPVASFVEETIAEPTTFEIEAPVSSSPMFEAFGGNPYSQSEPEDEIRPETEEKKELKIAFGSKKSGEHGSQDQYGISKLLTTQRSEVNEGSSGQGQEEPVLSADAAQEDNEEVRWKSLFIGNTEDQTPFRKVKLVIVQREETLDDIAERYQLSSRELQLYNRLSEQHLDEGQILYIP